jgi:hypothetical protein
VTYDYGLVALYNNFRDLSKKWGKVQLRVEEAAPGPTSTIGAPVEHLDLTTVIKVSEAISGEIVLEKLLDTLMRTAIAHAGAERGRLILSRGAEPRIEAQATTGGDMVLVELRDAPVTESVLPESILPMSCTPGTASFSTMPRPSPRLQRTLTSVSVAPVQFSACPWSIKRSSLARSISKTIWRPASSRRPGWRR